MNLKTLENRGLIQEFKPINPQNVQNQWNFSHRDIGAAKDNLKGYPDLAHDLAYSAMLASGRALMIAHGYRPEGNAKHYSVEAFLSLFLPRDMITIFGNMRRKRHTTEYETAGTISRVDATDAISDAERIIFEIKKIIEDMGFQL